MSPDTDSTTERAKPVWLLPVVVLSIVAALVALKRGGKDEVVENPLVDLAVLTVGVFAFGALFAYGSVKLGAPGAAAFFGHPQPAPAAA